ncbi:MAG: hypothetical protein VX999_01935 [Candidatus Thermoplasmatota archaeon]|nr:hypothetical protein [Candidatus Thermoplasmatota archaeon]
MEGAQRGSGVLIVALLMMVSLPYSPAAAEEDGACCESQDFELYLLGSADDGSLSPFDSDLDEEFEQFVTPSIQGLVEIGTWEITWGLLGNYPDATWEFRIPYEVESAAGIQINATVGVNIGSTYFEGDAGAGLFLTNEGEVVIPVEVLAGEVRSGDKVKLTFSVRSLSFSSPGDDAGIRFVWGTDEFTGRISMKFPLVSIDMKEPSVNGRLVYFPILLKSGFGDRMWSASSGGLNVASDTIPDSPIATPTNNGVEVTFAWQIPESAESGTYLVAFHLTPQTSLRIEANRTYDIAAGEGGSNTGGWYPAVEPLRTGGTSLMVDVEAKFDGDSVEREVTIEFDGAMSQWVRWGLDNIGNNSLSSNSWWRNLRTYSDSIPNSEFNNGQVDDSEIAALNSHLVGSASDMKSFLANGLYLDAESILGVNPVNLGPTEISIDLGHTRAFSAESVTIRIDTSHQVDAGERQQLIESFIRPSDDELYTNVELKVEIRSTALQGLGGVAAEDIEAKHRRWILLEVVTIDEDDLDPEASFRVEFVPTGGALYSPLVSAMVSVFMLVLALGLGMVMTRKRARVPSMLTVVVLGGLSLALYVLGLDMPFVLGVVASSMLLVFPVALVSPRSDFAERTGGTKRANAHVNCPNCGESNPVESDVRPLRLECVGCGSTLRLE